MTYEDLPQGYEDDEEYEEISYFNAHDCTCDHEPEQHSWGGCVVEGCPCEAAWEE